MHSQLASQGQVVRPVHGRRRALRRHLVHLARSHEPPHQTVKVIARDRIVVREGGERRRHGRIRDPRRSETTQGGEGTDGRRGAPQPRSDATPGGRKMRR